MAPPFTIQQLGRIGLDLAKVWANQSSIVLVGWCGWVIASPHNAMQKRMAGQHCLVAIVAHVG